MPSMNETVDIFPGGESSHSFNVSDAVSCNDDHNIMRDIKEQNQNTIVGDLQLNSESRHNVSSKIFISIVKTSPCYKTSPRTPFLYLILISHFKRYHCNPQK